MLGHRTLNVEDYLAILKRRWWIIAIPTLILPIVAFAVTFFIPPQYSSQTLVIINQQKVPEDIVRPVTNDDLGSRLASMQEQILSRSSMQPIIEKYNLYANKRESMDDRIDEARKATKIVPITSQIAHSNGLPGFKIFFTASDPHTAQQVCAEITALFTQANLRARQADAEGTTRFLQQQLDEAKRTLDDQDAKLRQFQQQYAGLLPEDENNNVNILNTLNSRLDATTQNLQSLEQTESFDRAMLAQQAQSASTGPAQAQSPALEQKQLEQLQATESALSMQYTDDYPDLKTVRRKISDLKAQMAKEASAAPAHPSSTIAGPTRGESGNVQQLRAALQVVEQAIANKRKEQAAIQQQIHVYEGRLQSTPEVEQQAKQLTRDHQTALDFYNKLLTQTQQANEATDLEQRQQGETFSLLDPANLPESPDSPKVSHFVLGGIVGGLALGLLIVGLLEYRDTALRSERDVWAFTQLPTLAVIVWSGEDAEVKASQRGLLKRWFARKAPKDMLPGTAG